MSLGQWHVNLGLWFDFATAESNHIIFSIRLNIFASANHFYFGLARLAEGNVFDPILPGIDLGRQTAIQFTQRRRPHLDFKL